MVNIDNQTLQNNKNNEEQLALNLSKNEIEFLVSELSDKNDELRYIAFKTLQKRSELYDDVYPYFNVFIQKLYADNSYQRSIGIMLIAKNIKWDKDNLFNTIYKDYFTHFTDEKFITSRQTIQSVTDWISYKPDLTQDTANDLMSIDLDKYKDTQKSLLLYDILYSLIEIYKISPSEDIKLYLNKSLQNGILRKENYSADNFCTIKINKSESYMLLMGIENERNKFIKSASLPTFPLCAEMKKIRHINNSKYTTNYMEMSEFS